MNYPSGPPGDCRNFSKALTIVYPELRYVEGTRTFTVHVQPDGHAESSTVDHAWNVTPAGEIWDATLHPKIRDAAQRGQLKITYTPD